MAMSSARRWFLIERKSFEVVLEGRQDDKVRFTEFRRRSRSSICLDLEEARWFVASWPSISKEPRVAGRCARYRKGDRCLLLSMHCNEFGWFIKLMEVWKGTAHTVVFPEGVGGSGWEKVRASSEEILKLRPVKVNHLKATEIGRAAQGFPPLLSQIHKGESQIHMVESSQIHKAESSQIHKAESSQIHKAESSQIHKAESSQIHKVAKVTKGWGNQELSIAIVCPCCGDSFEGTLSLKPALERKLHAAVMAAGKHNDDNEGGAKEQQTGESRSDMRTAKAKPVDRPVSKGKKPSFEIKKGVGSIFGRGKVRRPKTRYVRKDSLQGASSEVNFSDPLLGELCSIAEPQVTKALVLFEDLDPQTMYLCNAIDRKTEEGASGVPCRKEGDIDLTEKEGGSPSDQGDHPSPVGSPLASSEETLAMVVFEPRSVELPDTFDVDPIDSRPADLNADLTADEASKRVLAEVMDFSKIPGLSFDGQEDRAANLFSSIENRRLKEFKELKKKSATPISRELKRLECGVNYESSAKKGTARSSGKRIDEKG